MSDQEITLKGANELVADSTKFESFLKSLALPTTNVIASTGERKIVGENLPEFLNSISDEDKAEARYLSKFVGATAIGLFDAALNYVWNEVVINLRKKAVMYGIDLFFDAAVGGKHREFYCSEEDLGGLKDQVLLDTCRKLELISDIVYRKLVHILTMRNQIAASHPNVESIGGFELLGWLQTCVKDVLQDKPSESAIQIQSIILNIKATTDTLDTQNLGHFEAGLKDLSSAHIHNLLITLFGLFLADESSQVLRKNVALLATPIWSHSFESVKTKLAARIDGYRSNFQEEKINRAKEFLTLVDGLHFESLPAKVIALEELVRRLNEAHAAWDNFYNEPPIMKEILAYVKSDTDIPSEVKPQLIEAVLKCRIGNGVNYSKGVSSAGKPLYTTFLKLLDDSSIATAIWYLYQPHINSRLYNENCKAAMNEMLIDVKEIVISSRLLEAVDFLLLDINGAHKANKNKTFISLMDPWVQF